MKLGRMLQLLEQRFPDGGWFAGVGSRKAPQIALEAAADCSIYLCRKNWKLRSGAADGMDEAFEVAWTGPPGSLQIFLPKKGFNHHISPLYNTTSEAFQVARKYHPIGNQLVGFNLLAMGRNSHQVLGPQIVVKSDWSKCIICWTPDGANGTTKLTHKETTGGTGQAIRVAATHGIPVFNLANLEL